MYTNASNSLVNILNDSTCETHRYFFFFFFFFFCTFKKKELKFIIYGTKLK